MLELKDILLPFIFMIFYTILYFAKHKRKEKNLMLKQFFVKLIFVGYIGFLISLLLLYNTKIVFVENPNSFIPKLSFLGNNYIRTLNTTPFKTIFEQLNSGTIGYLNIIFNTIVLIPLPIFIKIIKPKLSYSVCMSITLVVTLFIETIQYFIGRSSDIDDIILNLFGALVGIIIFKFIIPEKIKSLFA